MIAQLEQKGSDQFMHISNNNTEYSRYENFDLTRMFQKTVFLWLKYTQQPWLTASESFSWFHYF